MTNSDLERQISMLPYNFFLFKNNIQPVFCNGCIGENGYLARLGLQPVYGMIFYDKFWILSQIYFLFITKKV